MLISSKTFLSCRNLDLSKFCIGQKDEMQHPPIYDLYAVINHYGGMIGGHYTAYARLPSDRNSQRSDVGELLFFMMYQKILNCALLVLVSNMMSVLAQAGVCLMTALSRWWRRARW